MKDIYLDRREFELKFNPKKPTSGLISLSHPELFITDKLNYHEYPKGFQDAVPSKVSMECNLILTNPAHDGIWLVADYDNDTLGIPSGHIDREWWEMYCTNHPYNIIYLTLIDAMVRLNPLYRDSASHDPYMRLTLSTQQAFPDIRDILHYVIGRSGFDIYRPCRDDLLFYQYWVKSLEYDEYVLLRDMKMFVLKEVTIPEDRIPALQNFSNHNFIWYSRKDHYYNIRTKKNRASLFASTFKEDARVSDDGLSILDNIFQTESIFGKLDIY